MYDFGEGQFADAIMLGAVARNLELRDKDILVESVLDIITKFQTANRQAFQVGLTAFNDQYIAVVAPSDSEERRRMK